MKTYKDQFTEWSPAYPVLFHREFIKSTQESFDAGIPDVVSNTVKSHSVAIVAINKAMNK